MLSIVCPVYRSATTLTELHQRLTTILVSLGDEYEILFVEDCGDDDSWEVIESIVSADPHVRGIKLSRNFGQHNALLCGIRAAQGTSIVTLDDDLQNPPEEIPHLLTKLEEGFDVVYGKPKKEQHGLLRDAASRITKLALQGAMGAETARNVSSFRAFHTRVRDAFSNYKSPTVNIDVLLAWGTTRFSVVSVRHEPREHGDSNYTLSKLIKHALNMMTGFSTMPLQVASVMGFIVALFGFTILLYVLARYLVDGGSVPGFPFLASIIAIFSGAQLLALGIFGEYLARMHFRSMDRPTYTIREDTGGKA